VNVKIGTRSFLKASVAMTVTAIIAGCGARIPEGVNVVSQKDQRKLSETFPAAFINRGPGGDYHVVLLRDRTKRKPAGEVVVTKSPGAPLKPLDLSDVRQVLHVHVFWNPMRGAKPDNPSATNAAIDWYLVRADTQGRVTGLVHYEGAGFVTTSVAEDVAGVIVRSAALTPTRVEGDMADPLGPIHLTARFDALHHAPAVSDVLAQVDKLKTGGPDLDAVRLTEPAAAAAVH
jgi:hypothetical protein